MSTYSTYITELQVRCGTRNLAKSRVKPLLDLLAQGPLPQQVLREVARTRKRTRPRTLSVNFKYGPVLDRLEDECLKQLQIRRHRRASFGNHLHVGPENELKGTTVVLLDNTTKQPHEIGYGTLIARTKAVSDVAKIALIELQVEGASGGSTEHSGTSGMIEHIGGPISVKDDLYPRSRVALGVFIDKLATTTSLLTEVVKIGTVSKAFIPLAAVLAAYHQELHLKDPELDLFALEEAQYKNCTWYVAVDKKIQSETQLNFEVPLRNVIKKDFIDLFDKERQRSPLLTASSAAAKTLVTQLFPAVVDKDKLAAFFAIYYFVAAVQCYLHRRNTLLAKTFKKAGMSDHEMKNQYEFLPKTPVNDLLRVAFTAVEKTEIAKKTAVASAFATLRSRMTNEILGCLAKAKYMTGAPDDANEDFQFDLVHDAYLVPGAGYRYEGESTTTYGSGPREPCGVLLGPDSACQRPKGHPDAHGAFVLAETPFTGTGKPVPVQEHYVEGEVGIEAVIVFEGRMVQDELAKIGKRDNCDATKGLASLKSAQGL